MIERFIPHLCISNQGHIHLDPPPPKQNPSYSVWVWLSVPESVPKRDRKRERKKLCVCVCHQGGPPKNKKITLWLATNGSIPVLILAGSESIFTEITEYMNFNLM